ncbi:hypothetical protein K474DRAFT_1670652 [Panus rudis PR-1116 ss-1]|nr:hypothetical protein K474DRAFT_1670652 [Panus rudis PR-1116 ss-1]
MTFPLEIFGLIIRECYDSLLIDLGLVKKGAFDDWKLRAQTLYSCSLTRRGWDRYAKPLLFHTIVAATDDQSYRKIHALANIIRERPDIGRLVKTLLIDACIGDPSWIPVTLHGKWLPNLGTLLLFSEAYEDSDHWDLDDPQPHSSNCIAPRSFYKFLASYRSGVRQLRLYHGVYAHLLHESDITMALLHALTQLTNITHLELTYDADPGQTVRYARNPPGSNTLRSLIIDYVGLKSIVLNRLITPAVEANMSLQKLELLYLSSSKRIQGLRNLLCSCSLSLRELHLDQSDYSTSEAGYATHFSLSPLRNLRRIRLEELYPFDTIHLLSTLVTPSTLTHLVLTYRDKYYDGEQQDGISIEFPWEDLDEILSLTAFPSLSDVDIYKRHPSGDLP